MTDGGLTGHGATGPDLTDRGLTVAALNSAQRIDSGQLLDFLEALRPDDPDLADLDIEQVASKVDPRQLSQGGFSRLIAALHRLRGQGVAVDVSGIQPQTFAALMARVTKDQLADVFARAELRRVILDEIFRRMGTHLRRDRAAGLDVLIRWRFTGGTGDAGLDRYETTIADGTCTVSDASEYTPRVTITLAPADLIQLIIGKASPPVLFMTGKLKVKGDLAFAAGLMGMFDLPRA